MAAQQPQLPVPNAANMQAAINGMAAETNNIAQNVQAYNAHQQALNAEVTLCGNYNVAQIAQQLNTIQASVNDIRALGSAQFWNLRCEIANSKVNDAAGRLAAMRSVDPNPNPPVPINQAIPNFPGTPDLVSQMTVPQCRNILTALDHPIPQVPQNANQDTQRRLFRTAVRGAIGLPAL